MIMGTFKEDVDELEKIICGLELLYKMGEEQALIGFLFQNRSAEYKFFTLPEMIEDLNKSLDEIVKVGEKAYNKLD